MAVCFVKFFHGSIFLLNLFQNLRPDRDEPSDCKISLFLQKLNYSDFFPFEKLLACFLKNIELWDKSQIVFAFVDTLHDV